MEHAVGNRGVSPRTPTGGSTHVQRGHQRARVPTRALMVPAASHNTAISLARVQASEKSEKSSPARRSAASSFVAWL